MHGIFTDPWIPLILMVMVFHGSSKYSAAGPHGSVMGNLDPDPWIRGKLDPPGGPY